MALTLTPAELEELTRKARPSAQIRWLRSKGYAFDVRGDGSVIVARAHALAKLGVVEPRGRRAAESATEPDFGALDVTA